MAARGGAWLRAGVVSIAFVPLLMLAAVVLGAAWGAWRSGLEEVETSSRASHRMGLLRRPVADALALWAGGYAACAALIALLASLGSPRPQLEMLVLPVLVVPVVAASGAAARLVSRCPELAGPRWCRPTHLPDVVRRALRPAATGVAAMLALGCALAVALVVLRFTHVVHLHDQLAPGLVGGVVLTIAQVLCLPNAGLWAVSFMAGAGFSVVEGASTTWTGSRSGLMPMVPALGALPDPGAFPGLLPALALVPVLVGALIGRRSLRSVARLSTTRTKLLVAGTAVALAAAALGTLDALAGGSIGAGRLADIGAPARRCRWRFSASSPPAPGSSWPGTAGSSAADDRPRLPHQAGRSWCRTRAAVRRWRHDPIRYTLMTEQSGPRELVRYAAAAERRASTSRSAATTTRPG